MTDVKYSAKKVKVKTYYSGSNRLVPLETLLNSTGNTLRERFRAYDDFQATTLDLSKWTVAGVAGAAVAAGTNGICVIAATAANPITSMSYNTVRCLYSTLFPVMKVRISFDAVTIAGGTFRIAMWNAGAFGGGAGDYLGFEFTRDLAATNTWLVRTANTAGGVPGQTLTTTTVRPVIGTFTILKISVDTDGITRFYIDGALVATRTNATQLPAVGQPMEPYLIINEAASGTNINATVDYVDITQVRA